MYCLFLQSVLKGKANDVYYALPTDQCSDYELVKERILQAYELIPEIQESGKTKWTETCGISKRKRSVWEVVVINEGW